MIEKKCVICGCVFNARNDTYKTCSPECSRKNKNALNRMQRAKKKKRKYRNSDHYTLSLIEKEARSVGLSYGFYVSKMNV